MPENKTPLDKYKKDYIEDAWMDYDIHEYVQWVSLLTRRATHRCKLDKAKKDIEDARSYLWMLEKALEEDLK